MLQRFLSEQEGQDMVEYGLLVAVVALALVAAITNFRDAIDAIWTALSARLAS